MKKILALILACVLLITAAPLALATTVAPGGEVTVEFPFSGDPSYLVHAEYTLSAGLSFKSGTMEGVTGGKAGKTQAIYVSYPSATTSGTLKLTLTVAADATGEQTVTLTNIRGYAPSAWHNLTGAGAKTVTVSTEPVTKSADVNGDGSVDLIDLMYVLSAYIGMPDPEVGVDKCDVDGSGEVDLIDLMIVLEAYVYS